MTDLKKIEAEYPGKTDELLKALKIEKWLEWRKRKAGRK